MSHACEIEVKHQFPCPCQLFQGYGARNRISNKTRSNGPGNLQAIEVPEVDKTGRNRTPQSTSCKIPAYPQKINVNSENAYQRWDSQKLLKASTTLLRIKKQDECILRICCIEPLILGGRFYHSLTIVLDRIRLPIYVFNYQ